MMTHTAEHGQQRRGRMSFRWRSESATQQQDRRRPLWGRQPTRGKPQDRRTYLDELQNDAPLVLLLRLPRLGPRQNDTDGTVEHLSHLLIGPCRTLNVANSLDLRPQGLSLLRADRLDLVGSQVILVLAQVHLRADQNDRGIRRVVAQFRPPFRDNVLCRPPINK